MHIFRVQLTTHFRDTEFLCKCGRCPPPTDIFRLRLFELAAVLEKVRLVVGSPLTVISGHRCEAHNKAVGGAEDSRHLYGDAVDIKVANERWPGERLRGVFEALIALEEIPDGGLGTYPDAKRRFTVHYDLRGEHARW